MNSSSYVKDSSIGVESEVSSLSLGVLGGASSFLEESNSLFQGQVVGGNVGLLLNVGL